MSTCAADNDGGDDEGADWPEESEMADRRNLFRGCDDATITVSSNRWIESGISWLRAVSRRLAVGKEDYGTC